MLINCRDSSTVEEREVVVNNIKSAFGGGISALLEITVIDTKDLIEQTLQKAQSHYLTWFLL